jgi:hypothetical protein
MPPARQLRADPRSLGGWNRSCAAPLERTVLNICKWWCAGGSNDKKAGVIVGEFQPANRGLGYLIQYGGQIFKMNIVMTAVTILAIVSSLMYLAISWLESAVMRRR